MQTEPTKRLRGNVVDLPTIFCAFPVVFPDNMTTITIDLIPLSENARDIIPSSQFSLSYWKFKISKQGCNTTHIFHSNLTLATCDIAALPIVR